MAKSKFVIIVSGDVLSLVAEMNIEVVQESKSFLDVLIDEESVDEVRAYLTERGHYLYDVPSASLGAPNPIE